MRWRVARRGTSRESPALLGMWACATRCWVTAASAARSGAERKSSGLALACAVSLAVGVLMSDDTKMPRPGRYRKVEVRTWGDERFRGLSAIPPCGQGLWLFLITGPHTSPIPGLFRAGRAAMAEELEWDLEAFDEAFAEVSAQGMVKADFRARLVWVPKAIRHNRPESPNVVRSWGAEFDLLPECDLKREAFEALKTAIHSMGEGFGKAFDEAFGKPSAKASAKTMPNQEQEQKQKQKNTEDPPASRLPPDCERPLEPRLDPEDGQSGALPGMAQQASTEAAQPGKAEKRARASTKCPDTFDVTDDLRQWAAAEVPRVDVERETKRMRDHTFAKARSDWPGTWRNWMRRAGDALPTGVGRNGRPPDRIDRQLETAGLMVGSAYGYPAAANPSTPPMEFVDVTARAIAA